MSGCVGGVGLACVDRTTSSGFTSGACWELRSPILEKIIWLGGGGLLRSLGLPGPLFGSSFCNSSILTLFLDLARVHPSCACYWGGVLSLCPPRFVRRALFTLAWFALRVGQELLYILYF